MKTTEGMPHLIKTVANYINVAYYFLLSPLKINYDKSADIITATKCNGIRKVFYIFIITVPQVVIVYYLVGSKFIRTLETQNTTPNTQRIDEAISTMTICGWFCLNTVIKFELWFAPATASKMLNKLMAVELRLKIPSNRLWVFKHPAVLVFLIYAVLTLTTFTDITVDILSSVHESWSVDNYLIYTFSLYETLVTHFGTKFVFLLCVIYFSCAHALQEHTKPIRSHNEISCVLRLMLEVSLSTKKCFGFTIVASCLVMLPYYANKVTDLFGNSFAYQYLYFHFIVTLALLLYLSAEANSKFNSSLPPYVLKRNYLSGITRNSIHIGQTEGFRRRKLLLLDAINREGLGLRGRSMTLNYPFFANVMASILAYSISIMQFQSSA